MADDRVAEAVDIVAHHLVAALVSQWAGGEWDMYPEISEDDWDAIVKRTEQIADNMRPDTIGFDAAYQYLEERADHGDAYSLLVDGGGVHRVIDVPLPDPYPDEGRDGASYDAAAGDEGR